jgi:hypothetical protein
VYLRAYGETGPVRRVCAAIRGGVMGLAGVARQFCCSLIEVSTIASNTGWLSLSELLMTLSIPAVAVNATASSAPACVHPGACRWSSRLRSPRRSSPQCLYLCQACRIPKEAVHIGFAEEVARSAGPAR